MRPGFLVHCQLLTPWHFAKTFSLQIQIADQLSVFCMAAWDSSAPLTPNICNLPVLLMEALLF